MLRRIFGRIVNGLREVDWEDYLFNVCMVVIFALVMVIMFVFAAMLIAITHGWFLVGTAVVMGIAAITYKMGLF